MLTILKLFGRSPFAPLQSHMEKVSFCVHLLPELFSALKVGDQALVSQIAEMISEKEHQADLTKNDIRNHLPKSLYLPVDRSSLLEILALQDTIADRSEDIAVLSTIKPIQILETFKDELAQFLQKNIETFESSYAVIRELDELLESSFGGVEAEKVRAMVEIVALKEHEADLIQRQLLKKFLNADEELTLSTFHIWQRIFEAIGAISNLSAKLAYRIRMTLELK